MSKLPNFLDCIAYYIDFTLILHFIDITYIFQLQRNITPDVATRRSSKNKYFQNILKIPSSNSNVVAHLNLNSACSRPTSPKVVLVVNTSQKNSQNFFG